MQIASIDSHSGSGSRVYFYCFTVVLLGVLMKSVQGVSVAAGGEDRPTYGTVLYKRVGTCFSPDNPRIVEAKRIFQDMMPYRKKRFEPLSDEVIESLLLYFSSVGSMVDKLVAKYDMVVAAWYDTAGDYLHSYLYPISKYCFYSGNVSYYSVRNVQDYYREVKLRLDTDGTGWSRPNLDVTDAQSNVQVFKVYQKHFNCSELVVNATAEIPLPNAELDDETREVISLWVPFKGRQVYDPRTKASLSILRIYAETILHCVHHRKQTSKFANQFIKWIEESLAKHYMDDQFYPGLEAILRIKKTLEADVAAKATRKKSITENDDESSSGSKGFLESLFGSDESRNVQEDSTDEQQEDERRWLRIKLISATIIVALFILIFVVFISVKLRMNRKTMKRKAATRNERSKPWSRKKLFRQKEVQSDEEVLLMLKKQPGKSDHSETSESGWKHVKPQKLGQKSQKPGTSKQIPPFSDTENDDAFIPFQPKQHSSEKIPLIKKDDRKKKGRCGRGCLCMSCVRKSRNGHQDIQDSSAYKLASEKHKKVDKIEDTAKSTVEQPATIKPTAERNLRDENVPYRVDTWHEGK